MDTSGSSDEADSPLDRGCLLGPNDILYSDLSIIVPETPSPQLGKRRRPARVTQEGRTQAAFLECSSGAASHDLTPPRKRRKKPSAVTLPSCSASSCATPPPRGGSPAPEAAGHPLDSLSFLTEEERRWLSGEQQPASTGRGRRPPPACSSSSSSSSASSSHSGEQIVISDDEEGLLRTVQLEEDEAFARSLQAQFDQEEVETHRHRHQQHMFFPTSESGWMPHLLAAVSPLVAFDNVTGPSGRHRAHSRRRNMPGLDFSDDPQGNDYEALLEFEERQGAVVSRKLTRQQIQRFPTKTFQPGADAGCNTQCQICFCDYTGGDKLRILPCFHDYHVRCIDRWLKDNTTCPICRSNLADL